MTAAAGQSDLLLQVKSKQKIFSNLAWPNLLNPEKDFERTNTNMVISCGSVGRAVASDTKGPQFESSHRQTFYI